MYVLKLNKTPFYSRTIDTAWHSNQKREVHTAETSQIYKQKMDNTISQNSPSDINIIVSSS